MQEQLGTALKPKTLQIQFLLQHPSALSIASFTDTEASAHTRAAAGTPCSQHEEGSWDPSPASHGSHSAVAAMPPSSIPRSTGDLPAQPVRHTQQQPKPQTDTVPSTGAPTAPHSDLALHGEKLNRDTASASADVSNLLLTRIYLD